VVNVSVCDEDVCQVGERDRLAQRGGGLFEARLQSFMTALAAGAGVDEREHVTCLHEVGVDVEIRKSLKRQGKDARAAGGGKGLEGGTGGHCLFLPRRGEVREEV
jgi:hypothetical protein